MPADAPPRTPPRRLERPLSVLIMLVATAAVYVPAPPRGAEGPWTLHGVDFLTLHARRLAFAREALFSDEPRLPAWYPRELMGTPFWANAQNFPLIPTRWPLLVVDPAHAYLVGIVLAATLSALFTWLYCRRLGLSPLASAVAGWTFACSGFFASRVIAGHLPLLEAYPALPMLLWLVERFVQEPAKRPSSLAWLAVACAATAQAGHPQVPVYCLLAAGVYALFRSRGRERVLLAAAMGVGVGLAAFSLYPMLLLTLRSTRILPLAPPDNDVAFPVWRLAAFVYPAANGVPSSVEPSSMKPFTGPPVVFWDTVCYLGVLPVVAAAVLAVRQVRLRRLPSTPFLVIGAIAVLALLTALPPVRGLTSKLPGTILRSPARQIYLTTFGLALAAGVACHLLAASLDRRLVGGVLATLLTLHAIDVAWHARTFITAKPFPRGVHDGRSAVAPAGDTSAERAVLATLGDARVAYDQEVRSPLNRRYDDVGFFDSLMLARPYRHVIRLAGLPESTNVQQFNGSVLPRGALASLGVRYVVTREYRYDLPIAARTPNGIVYEVPDPAPRASIDGRPCAYRRPSSDRIDVDVDTTAGGTLKILESFDPGWSATIDGRPAAVTPVEETFLSVAVPPGRHAVSLTYRTPGARAGIGISVLCLFLTGGLCYYTARKP